MPLEDIIPQVEWPSEDGIYKVVQFYVDDKPYLRFSAKTNNHSNIVAEFAQRMKIRLKWDVDRDVAYFFDESEHKIAGMGKCDYRMKEKSAEFFGWSNKYKTGIERLPLRIDQEHLDLIRQMFRDLNIDWNITYNLSRIK